MTVEDCTIRENWREIELGELATFRTGPFGSTFHKADYVIGGTPLINPSHIVDGDIVPDETITVRPELAKRLSVFALREGEIVIGRRGDMGRCAVVKRRHDGFLCGTGSMIVRPRPGINAHLLQALLSSPEVVARIEENSVGTTMINLNQGTLASLKIRISTEAKEQEAIAEALSDSDALIEGLERLIAKKRLIKQGAMQDLLTAKRRLPGFSGEWVERRLGEVARIATGSRNNQDKDPMGNYPFFVRSDHVERIRSWSYDCEAILVPGEGRIGEIFHYIDGKFDLHQRVYCISGFSEEVSARYIHAILMQFFGKHAMTNTVKATVDSLRRPTFTGFGFLCPPSLGEQDAIADVLTDMDAEIQALETRLEKARQIKEGMMQNLLTGRVRLV